MNPPDESKMAGGLDPKQSFSREQQVATTLMLLILGYMLSSKIDLLRPEARRISYETVINIVPSVFIYNLQKLMIRLGYLADTYTMLRRQDFGDFKAKEQALSRMFGTSSPPTVIDRARSLSSYKLSLASEELGPPGLGNWDYSCYQNSILQGLASLAAFRNYIAQSLQIYLRNGSADTTTQALTTFVDQLADTSAPSTTLWTPRVLKSMNSWQQQDAQEYFTRILEALDKEAAGNLDVVRMRETRGLACLTSDQEGRGSCSDDMPSSDARSSSIHGPVQQVLDPIKGWQAQSLVCQVCGFTEGYSLTEFSCLTLSLGLGGPCDIKNLLEEYVKPELIEGVECENCTKLAADADSKDSGREERRLEKPVLRTKAKQITLCRLPKNLVLHINRSIFDDFGNQKKNVSMVKFPMRLDILGEWCALPLNPEPQSAQAVYQLKCIVSHSGRHDNGHYVSFGQRGKDWFCFNDEIVTKVAEESVLGRGNVFMLFYECDEPSSEPTATPAPEKPALATASDQNSAIANELSTPMTTATLDEDTVSEHLELGSCTYENL